MSGEKRRRDGETQRRSGDRGGFTLIELLVVMGVIGVLMALLLPALRGTRAAALQTVSLANVRSVGQVISVYAGEHGRHPFRGLGEYPTGLRELIPGWEPDPGAAMYYWYPGGVLIGTTGHFDQTWLWPSVTVALEEWPEHWETWVSPRKDQKLPEIEDFTLSDDNPVQEQISVRYSNAFVARPEYFSDKRGADQSRWGALLKATRPSDVRYPSGKVVVWDNDLAYRTDRVIERVDGLLDAPTPMCFADGHGAAKETREAGEAYENPLTGIGTRRLSDTRDGVYGRDYQ